VDSVGVGSRVEATKRNSMSTDCERRVGARGAMMGKALTVRLMKVVETLPRRSRPRMSRSWTDSWRVAMVRCLLGMGAGMVLVLVGVGVGERGELRWTVVRVWRRET
jgi:hypothetical protein